MKLKNIFKLNVYLAVLSSSALVFAQLSDDALTDISTDATLPSTETVVSFIPIEIRELELEVDTTGFITGIDTGGSITQEVSPAPALPETSSPRELNSNISSALTPIINLILNDNSSTENTLFPAIPPLTTAGPHIRIESDSGDFIGQGLSYEYTPASTIFTIDSNFDNGISISIDGSSLNSPQTPDNWRLDLSNGSTRLEVGQYNNASRFPFNASNENGLSFSGNGRGCNRLIGEFTIFEVEYNGDELQKLTADFTQYCEEQMNSALRGSIRFDASLPPEELDSNSTPVNSTLFPVIAPLTTAGPIMRIESDLGDSIGRGLSYEYTPESTIFDIRSNFDNGITILIDGSSLNTPQVSDNWRLELSNGSTRLEVGQYDNTSRFPFNNDIQNGLNFSGNGRGCSTSVGEFTIFEIEYDGDELLKLTADFTQYCGGQMDSATRGSIRFDATLPTEEVNPNPAPINSTLFPAIAPLTTTGPIIRIESDSGDSIGRGLSYEYTPESSSFNISNNFDDGITISIDGSSLNTPQISDNWRLELSNGGTRLEVGQYDNTFRFPFNNDIQNGLSFTGNGRGCNTSSGEFTIFEIEYNGDELQKLTADFTQYCGGQTESAIRGSIRFNASITSSQE